MRKPFYSIISNKASTAGEIMIYGIIGPGYWSDGVMAKQFVRDFQQLERQFDRINIRVNGPGGSVWEGLPIFNAIRASKADTHTYLDGIAFSMSMVILLAGGTIHVAKGSIGMLHNVSGGAAGHANDMREAADVLDKHDKVLTTLIAGRIGKTEAEVTANYLNFKDNFFTAQELVDEGLADIIEDYDAVKLPADAKNMTMDQFAAYYQEENQEPSPALVAKITAQVTDKLTNQNTNMKLPLFTAFVSKKEPTNEELDAVNAELGEAGMTGYALFPESLATDAENVTKERDELKNQLTTANNQVTTLTNQVNTLKGEKTALENKVANAPAAVAPIVAAEDKPTEKSAAEIAEENISGFAHNQYADSFLNN